MVTFTDRLSDDNDYKREELIKKIEHALGQMTLKELEALSYDMFTKGYLEDYPHTECCCIRAWDKLRNLLQGMLHEALLCQLFVFSPRSAIVGKWEYAYSSTGLE